MAAPGAAPLAPAPGLARGGARAREWRGDARLGEAAVAAEEAREGDYHALLGAGGVASPRAAAHAGFLDPGRILADLDVEAGRRWVAAYVSFVHWVEGVHAAAAGAGPAHAEHGEATPNPTSAAGPAHHH